VEGLAPVLVHEGASVLAMTIPSRSTWYPVTVGSSDGSQPRATEFAERAPTDSPVGGAGTVVSSAAGVPGGAATATPPSGDAV
jgi:hypothetical protein